ncbi:hypothetical protein LT875_002506 [Salmonella enterica]|nr:hypothetical protein [Salmonella enterica]
MIHLFSTPRGYLRAAGILMGVNIGNIITFSAWFSFWMDQGLWGQGLFVAVFHFLTIILLTFMSARFAAAGNSLKAFIHMMERNGFVYDEQTKEFKPGQKM